MGPMLTQYIRWITVTRDMIECNHSRGNRFTREMIIQRVVALVQWGMWDRTALVNGFVVTEHVRPVLDRNPKVLQRESQCRDLLNRNSGGDELGTVSR